MKDPSNTSNILYEAHHLIVSLAKEFRTTLCERVNWTETGYIDRLRRNARLKHLEAEEISAVMRAVLSKALESCK